MVLAQKEEAVTKETYKKLSVIIPAYNEALTIREVVSRVASASVHHLKKEIIVVDDCSKDETKSVLSDIKGIKVIHHKRNKGKGGSVKTGIACATGDILLIQDADLEYDPEDYHSLLLPILKGTCEFVMGSRFMRSKPRFFIENGDPFFTHYIGNIIIIWFTNFLFSRKHTDYEGCYKVFTKALADKISVKATGFNYDNELICKSLKRGYNLVEVPIRYTPRSYAQGKKINWRDGILILWTIFKCRFIIEMTRNKFAF